MSIDHFHFCGKGRDAGATAMFADLRVVFNHRTLELFTIDKDGNTELLSAESDEELGTLLGLHEHQGATGESK